MTRRELDAAGIRQPAVRAAYRRCRRLNAEHGRTYFLATRLLSPERRPAVHALYGFARWVDDVVDEPASGVDDRDRRLRQLDGALRAGLDTGRSDHPILAALADTVRRHAIDRALFTDFMTSMRMDLTVRDYPDRAALEHYVHGSAAVIGLQVLPVLGTVSGEASAASYAAALGRAFQLTNFIRDVGEDLDRGRVYLPADELAAFGVDRERLTWCRRRGRPDASVRRALADQVARTKAAYRAAEPGIALLAEASRPCVATAFTLYGEILDRVVESGYEVFGSRLAVANSRRLSIGLTAASATAAARVASGLRRRNGSPS
ncbi:phytoene/squalene synthase family protein [Saccharopolyspora erythraea]|uniref:phytoene/squalene synthase family protein n=1 Tax=Saccharopolyspora erythraea TaxID=1836 RepID=UPI001BA99D85|nr:phytoene/squalene synthase family protein [Saccharopolyspora erythraea]QUH02997.1 phytoene/squalene synthase family protein [Saccharopolyspora erythraea]